MDDTEKKELLIKKLDISITGVVNGEHNYKTYTITLDGNEFDIKKRSDSMWISSEIVNQYGDEILSYIGQFIDTNY